MVGMAFPVIAALAGLFLVQSSHAAGMLPVEAGESGRFAAVGRVNNGTGTYCTGVLVGPDVALTSAHCLINRRTGRWLKPDSIHFLLGYDRGSYGFHATVAEYRTGAEARSGTSGTPEGDWALLRLRKKAPDKFAPVAVGGETAGPFQVVGFASPRKYALSRSTDCVARRFKKLLLSRCPSSGGMSGAPLIDLRTGRLIGIQVARTKQGDMLVALPSSIWSAELARFR